MAGSKKRKPASTPRGEKWILAAQMVARGEKEKRQICAELGISVPGLWKWEQDEEFQAEVARIRAAFRAALIERGVADKANRLGKYAGLLDRMFSIIEARSCDPDAEMVRGERSGLIARDVRLTKSGEPIDIGRFDKGLVSEIREVLKQVAIEVGDWQEKRELSGPNGGPITFLDLVKAAAVENESE